MARKQAPSFKVKEKGQTWKIPKRGLEGEWYRDVLRSKLITIKLPKRLIMDYVKVAKVLATYFVVLRNASDEIEGIDRTPKQPVNTTPVKTLDEIKYDSSDDDIPF